MNDFPCMACRHKAQIVEMGKKGTTNRRFFCKNFKIELPAVIDEDVLKPAITFCTDAS